MKLFVTGGTGFVGSHFLTQALAAGHEIVALRRPGSLPRVRVPESAALRWIDGALDGDHCAVLKTRDALVHLASHTPNPPYDSLERCLYWNVQASIGLATQAVEQGVQRFIIAGSCFEYGRACDRYAAIPVDAPLEPQLSYPSSKAAASVAFLGMAREFGLQLQLMRLFQVYGEGEQASRFWPALRVAAQQGRDFPMSPGLQVRDFVDVGEVARQLVAALDCAAIESGQPRVRHVASGRAQTLLAFAEHWWRVWHATGRLLPGAVGMRAGETMRIVPAMENH